MNKLKKILINFILYIKYGYKSSSKRYYKYLNNKGIKLGKNVKFYSPWSISIDIQRPWMIEIGDNVHITSGCRILQHGYDWCVLQHKYGDVLGSSGKVTIGNNVFIGVETTILKGVTIGNDVIIGAKTLVNKDCIEPGVYAGNPVRFIMSIDEYYEKRKQRQIKEATELMKEYYNKYGNYPKKELLREFFWLFEKRKTELNTTFMDVINLEGNEKISMQSFLNSKPVFNGYNEFIKYVGGNYDSKNKKNDTQ